MKEFTFDAAFKDADLTRSIAAYGLKLRVAVPLLSPMNMDLQHDWMTKRYLRDIFLNKPMSDTVNLVLPERWLLPNERQMLVNAIVQHPSVKNGDLKGIDILTHDDYILTDCDPQIVRILQFTKKGAYKGAKYLPISTFAASREEVSARIFGRD